MWDKQNQCHICQGWHEVPGFQEAGGNHAAPGGIPAGLAVAEVPDSALFASTGSSRIHHFPFLRVV